MTSVFSRIATVVALASFAAAPLSAAGLGFYGWGPRLGVADSPDQVIVGFHQDFGEFVERVRFQLAVEGGFGDDATTAALTLPVHVRFPVGEGFVPYFGGGIVVAYTSFDNGRKGGSDTELAPVLIGGFEQALGDANDLLLELHLGLGDQLWDAKLVVGWIFRAR